MTEYDKATLRTEANRVEEACMHSAQNQFEQAKIWRRWGTTLAVPAAVLAAVSGATGLAVATSRVFAAILALLAAGFVAASGTLNLGRRVEQAHASASAYLAVQQDARIFQQVDLPSLNYGDARQRLGELVARQQEINATAPIPSPRARRRAQKNISSGGQQYEADGNRGANAA